MKAPDLILIIGIIFFLFSCKKENPPVVYQVPDEVKPFIESFENEAANRGHDIQFDNLMVELSNEAIMNGSTFSCGIAFGELTNDLQNVIRIDTQCLAWRYGGLAREILIYHELGHVFLKRLHTDELLPNDEWKSIMTSQNWLITDFYINDLPKREYYLDELFEPLTEIPDWAK